MTVLGLSPLWYAVAIFLGVLVGALSPRTGEAPTRIRPWALLLGFLLYVALVVVTWARGRPIRRTA